jgi:hypothetical protein
MRKQILNLEKTMEGKDSESVSALAQSIHNAKKNQPFLYDDNQLLQKQQNDMIKQSI